MSTSTLEQRVEALEAQYAKLLEMVQEKPARNERPARPILGVKSWGCLPMIRRLKNFTRRRNEFAKKIDRRLETQTKVRCDPPRHGSFQR